MEFKHIPIMLEECIKNLNIKPDGIYVDATIGGAGHGQEIAKKLSSKGTLIGIDKDEQAIRVCKDRLKNSKCKIILVQEDFKNFKKVLEQNQIKSVDGILADLGVSSYQIDEAERGFSYSKDVALDMRMNQKQTLDAKYVVNNYDEKSLIKILFEYGEESFSKRIAKNILEEREKKPIETSGQLVRIIENSVPKKILYKGGSVAKKTFQAIRIEVNQELETLKNVLDDMIDSMKTDGRLCIITFHSLEDRIVKNNFVKNSTGCICPKNLPICVCNHKPIVRLTNKKPITPMPLEVASNPRSSSSKLRVAEKL